MEKKKSWNDLPSLDGLEMDWEYKSEASVNKRSSVRMRMEALAKLFELQDISVKVLARGETFTARLLDLSSGGLSLDMPVELETNLPIKLGFFLGQMKIISKAEVRHVRKSEDRYITGIKFIDLDNVSAEFLRELYASQIFRHAL
jgi:c-di-GMP-binding flagellar brake protein YcgR